jgi:4-hydroxy-4-methyl-2-oxoglutarate aldolase
MSACDDIEPTDLLIGKLARVSTSAVYDVARELGISIGVLPRSIRALKTGMKLAGPIFTVRGRPDPTLDSYTTLLEWTGFLSSVPPRKVVVCQPQDNVRALMGELSAESMQTKGVLGYLTDGGCRDVEIIRQRSFPIFCRYKTPIDIVGAWRPEQVNVPIVIGEVQIPPEDFILGDEDGVIVFPRTRAEEIISRAEELQATESELRTEIRKGMDPQKAFLKFSKF